MATIQDEKSLKCDFCSLKLENYHLFCQHLQQFHNIAFIQCEYCNLELPSKSELEKHVSDKHTYGGSPRVECSICPATFLCLKGLNRHMNQNHNPDAKVFPCQQCNRVYRNSSSLLNHTKVVHQPLRYLKCDKCPKIFSRKQTLKLHQDVEHNKNFKKLKCPLCPSLFKYRSNLSHHVHERHYSNTKAVSNLDKYNKCNLCYEQFPDKATLLSHRKSFHKRHIDIYSCDECPAVFKLREAFDNHLWEEHNIINKSVKQEDDDYLFQDFVDFETIMMNDVELHQLMRIRKSRKFDQKLVLVSYAQEQLNHELDVDEAIVEKICKDVNIFFSRMINPKKITDDQPSDFMQSESHSKNDTSVFFSAEESNYKQTNLDSAIEQSSTVLMKKRFVENRTMDDFNSIHERTYSSDIREDYPSNDVTLESFNSETTEAIGEQSGDKIKVKLRKKAKSGRNCKLSQNKIKLVSNYNNDSEMSESNSSLLKFKEHTETLIDCNICYKKFKLRAHLARHMNSKHKTARNLAKINFESNKNQELCDSHMNVSSVMFPCEHCNALFPCAELLLNHCSWQHSN